MLNYYQSDELSSALSSAAALRRQDGSVAAKNTQGGEKEAPLTPSAVFCAVRRRLLPMPNNNGHSLVEMTLALMLVLVFALTAFSLIFSGSQTYERLQLNKENSADARIIESTFISRMHQFDYKDGFECVNINWNGADVKAAVFKEESDGYLLKTWLFWSEGSLYEGLTIDDEELTADIVQILMSNDNIDMALDQDASSKVNITVDYPFGGETKTLAISYFPRAV